MSIADPLPLILSVAGATLAGRLLLALLPADNLDRRQLPATLATSLCLGWAALALELDLASRAGLAHRTLLLSVPWAILLLLRLATLPGAISPRHTPREEPRPPLFWLLSAVLAGWLGYLATHLDGSTRFTGRLPKPHDVPAALHLTIIAAFVLHGLRTVRRKPSLRMALVIALCATPALGSGDIDAGARLSAAGVLAGGTAYGLAWLRRANRRAAVLAVLAFALVPLTRAPGTHAAGLASLAALVIASPGPRRAHIARLAAAGALFHALHYNFAGCPPLALAFEDPQAIPTTTWWVAGLFALALATRNASAQRQPATSSATTIDPPRREVTFVAIQLLAGSLAIAFAEGLEYAHVVMATPLAAIAAGMALPSETAPRPAFEHG